MAKTTPRAPVRTARKPQPKRPRRPRKGSAAPAKAAPERKQDRVSAAGGRGSIRIYRHGLGDCILVRLKRQDRSDYKILIDCGVAVATQRADDTMNGVMRDVLEATDGSVDVLVVTHEHWDHLSGFSQAKEEFAKLKVGEVWLAWTEDEQDELARALRKDRANALKALTDSAARLRLSGNDGLADSILNVSGHFGAAGEKTKAAFDIVKAKTRGKSPRYWQPTDQPVHLQDPDVRIYALGPPHDAKAIRKTLPSKRHPETYELALNGRGVFPAEVISALGENDDGSPFAPTVTIPLRNARSEPFFRDRYWGTPDEDFHWRRIDGDWLAAADDLALALQSATNNTSLVLAIELADGDVLLFVGDAQVGNWLSWQDLQWKVDGREVTGPDLLGRTVFYKVGHHGSHNATLREKGLAMMPRLRTAVIPVDHEVALKMRWGNMPLEPLMEALKQKVGSRLLRTDIQPTAAIDGVVVDQLYYEVQV